MQQQSLHLETIQARRQRSAPFVLTKRKEILTDFQAYLKYVLELYRVTDPAFAGALQVIDGLVVQKMEERV